MSIVARDGRQWSDEEMTKSEPAGDPPERVRRRKRLGDEAREEGLVAARKLLLADGPGAVTLANVGRELGMSHANVLHHFGSAAGLQSALMGSMIRDLTTAESHVPIPSPTPA